MYVTRAGTEYCLPAEDDILSHTTRKKVTATGRAGRGEMSGDRKSRQYTPMAMLYSVSEKPEPQVDPPSLE